MNNEYIVGHPPSIQYQSHQNYNRPQNDGYPINRFPFLIRDAILEVAFDLDMPVGLVADSALSAISIACQDKINVNRYNKFKTPVSLFIFTIAERGTGKSESYKKFMDFIGDFESKKLVEFEIVKRQYVTDHSRWSNEFKGINNAIILASKKELPLDALNKKHDEIMHREPIMPKKVKLKFEKVHPTLVLESLRNDWPSAGLISSEGGTIFNSQALQNLGDLNKLWSGEEITLDRKTESSFTLTDARFSLFVMTQTNVFSDYLKNKGSLARDNGFLDRCLISHPKSTASELSNSITNYKSTNQHLATFGQRLTEILNRQSPVPPLMLELSQPANNRLKYVYDKIKAELKSQGFDSETNCISIRLPEIAARLAALFHFFCGRDGLIDEELIIGSIDICEWYQNQYQLFCNSQQKQPKIARAVALPKSPKIANVSYKMSQDDLDVEKLEHCLMNLYSRANGRKAIKLKCIEENIGHPLKRSELRRRNAIQFLINQNKISWILLNNEYYINLNTNFYNIHSPAIHDNLLPDSDAIFWRYFP